MIPDAASLSLREQLAALAHEQWSGWMKHLFSLTVRSHPAGREHEVIQGEVAERWKRQMRTPYAELSEAEKESDRAEADRVLDVLARLPVEGKTKKPDETVVMTIEVDREDNDTYFASYTTGKEGGCGDYSPTIIGALANLLCTLLKVEEGRIGEEPLKFSQSATSRPAETRWQPIDTMPASLKDAVVFFWIVPRTPGESYLNTSKEPIVVTFTPYLHRGKYGTWSAVSKATHWQPDLAPPSEKGADQ